MNLLCDYLSWECRNAISQSLAPIICLLASTGSERVKKSFSTGKTFKEATEINSSLLVLSRVLRTKITPGNSHVPYRDSVLTTALEDMFESSNHRAVLFACISPTEDSVTESEHTLRFASNATYVQQPSTSTTQRNGVLEDTKAADLSQLCASAVARKGIFGAYDECMLPASGGFPRLHCIGREASLGNDNCETSRDYTVETVVLLHYYGGACFDKGAGMWSEMIQTFPAHLRVIALSFSGHGLSEGSPPRSAPEAVRFLEPLGAVAQVERVMDYFGVARAHLIGYDYGGGVAMQMTLCTPRRVLSLCAWNPSYRISPDLEAHQKGRQQQRQWIPKTTLIITPSVWMPGKKITSLQSFMNTKGIQCRADNDVWKTIFKLLQQVKK